MKELIDYGKVLFLSMDEWWHSYPFGYKIILSIVGFSLSLWGEINVFILSMFVLIYLDTHFGIKASQAQGIPFNSKKRRKGLLDKMIIYLLCIVLTLIVDSMAFKIYDFGKHWLTLIALMYAGLYEVTSIFEKLKIIYPESRLVQRLSKIFLLMEIGLDKKVDDKLDIVEQQIDKEDELH